MFDEEVKNTKLTIDENINWSFEDDKETYLSVPDIKEEFELYLLYNCNYNYRSSFSFYSKPWEKFGVVIQKWVKEMGFKSVKIVMDGVGGRYVNHYQKTSIKFKIYGFKYQLSDDERKNLMSELCLQDGDTLEVVNDNEDNEDNENVIIIKEGNDWDYN